MIALKHINPDENMYRYYQLDLKEDLLGWWVIRKYGRIGKKLRIRHDQYATEKEARSALTKLEHLKRKKGYI